MCWAGAGPTKLTSTRCTETFSFMSSAWARAGRPGIGGIAGQVPTRPESRTRCSKYSPLHHGQAPTPHGQSAGGSDQLHRPPPRARGAADETCGGPSGQPRRTRRRRQYAPRDPDRDRPLPRLCGRRVAGRARRRQGFRDAEQRRDGRTRPAQPHGDRPARTGACLPTR